MRGRASNHVVITPDGCHLLSRVRVLEAHERCATWLLHLVRLHVIVVSRVTVFVTKPPHRCQLCHSPCVIVTKTTQYLCVSMHKQWWQRRGVYSTEKERERDVYT